MSKMGPRAAKLSLHALFARRSMIVDGKPVRAIEARCRCGHAEAVKMNSVNGSGADNDREENRLATRKFEGRGWIIGHNGSTHLCPACAKIKIEKPIKEALMSSVTPINQPQSKLPAKLPSDELQKRRRRIDNKLSEVYDDATGNYLAGWTDKRVAEELVVPQALVVEVREFSYGTQASNPGIEAELARARELVAEARQLLARVDDIEKRLIDIQQTVHP